MEKQYNHKGIAVKSSSYPEGWSEKLTDEQFNGISENMKHLLHGDEQKFQGLVQPSTFRLEE